MIAAVEFHEGVPLIQLLAELHMPVALFAFHCLGGHCCWIADLRVVGAAVGWLVGDGLGAAVGVSVGADVGTVVGEGVGAVVGEAVGAAVGPSVGAGLGTGVGIGDGAVVGADVGGVGAAVGVFVILDKQRWFVSVSRAPGPMRRCGSRRFESCSITSEAAAADVTDTLT